MKKTVNSFASALYDLGLENNQLSVVLENSKQFKELLTKELQLFLNTNTISKKTKQTILKDSLKGFSDTFINFLMVVLELNHSLYLKETLDLFEQKAYKALNIKVIDVYYAKNIDLETINQLKQSLKNKYHQDIILMTHQDDDLISGYKIIVDNEVYDSSLKHRFAKLKENILKEGD